MIESENIIECTVIRDEFGNVINIGDWDYIITIDVDGNEVINNPIPDRTTSSVEKVVLNLDGSRCTIE